MVIDYLNLVRVALAPHEAYAPLIVDPDAVLAQTIALQALKPITWYCRKHQQIDRRVQHLQFPEGDTLDCLKPRRAQAVEEPFSLRAPERANH